MKTQNEPHETEAVAPAAILRYLEELAAAEAGGTVTPELASPNRSASGPLLLCDRSFNAQGRSASARRLFSHRS